MDRRVKKLTKAEKLTIIKMVRYRDHGRCLIHGTAGAEVHEILQKSGGRVRSEKIFDPKYMACVCRDCHFDIHHRSKKKQINDLLLKILKERYAYEY